MSNTMNKNKREQIKENERIVKALKKDGKKLYSYSKLSTIEQCPYQAYLSYIAPEYIREQGRNNIWAILGGKLHQVLENIVNGETATKTIRNFTDKAVLEAELNGYEFSTETIRNNWIANVKHFCNTFRKPQGDYTTEEFFLYRLDNNHYLQGYIDLIKRKKNGKIDIIDWKTSSLYKGDALEKAKYQLAIYAMACENMGFKVDRIGWNFIKYAKILKL